jgi:hypothetical protein
MKLDLSEHFADERVVYVEAVRRASSEHVAVDGVRHLGSLVVLPDLVVHLLFVCDIFDFLT